MSPMRMGLVLFAIAFLIRVAFIFVFHPYRDLSRYELERTAISLATTGVYGNPYALPTGPTAHVSPGYTLILAGLFRIFGTGISAEVIKELLAAAVTSLGCALLPLVARGLSLDVRAGLLAGLVSALYPATPLTQIDGDWEAPYTALFLMVLSAATVQLWKKHCLNGRTAIAHGVGWGLGLLFVSALLPMFLAFVVLGAYICRKAGLKRYFAFAVIEVAVAAVCLTPWVVRNYYALGSPILTRSNVGIELRVSNNDFASPDQRVNYLQGVYAKYHPLQNAGEARKVRSAGEVAYNKKVADDTKKWIRTHTGRFLELCIGRARCFWLYQDSSSRVKTLFLNATVLLGFAGLIYLFRHQPITGFVLLTMLIIYPLPNYLIHVGLRQEYPIQWLMTLLSAAVLIWVWDWVHMRRRFA
jgi:hypothetical protein